MRFTITAKPSNTLTMGYMRQYLTILTSDVYAVNWSSQAALSLSTISGTLRPRNCHEAPGKITYFIAMNGKGLQAYIA